MNYKYLLKRKLYNPAFQIKIALISILFIFAINIELGVDKGYSISLIGKNDLNFMLFSSHIFSYFDIYFKYFLIGLIVLIPDIIEENYLTHQIYIKNRGRKTLFINTIIMIGICIAFFIAWFLILTLIFSMFRIRFFDFTWPSDLMNAIYAKSGINEMELMSIPESASQMPIFIVFFLTLLKTFIGFFIIALAAFYISFKKNNVVTGMEFCVGLYIISHLLFYSGPIYIFKDTSKYINLKSIETSYGLSSFFTYRDLSANFMQNAVHAFIYGAIIIVILLLLIFREFKRKDL